MAKTKTDKVIRRVVLGTTYNIFSLKFVNGLPTMELLETLELQTRPTEAEMVEKHKVDKVVIISTATKVGHYGVDITKFMEIATLEKTEVKELNKEEKTEEKEEEPKENK